MKLYFIILLFSISLYSKPSHAILGWFSKANQCAVLFENTKSADIKDSTEELEEEAVLKEEKARPKRGASSGYRFNISNMEQAFREKSRDGNIETSKVSKSFFLKFFRGLKSIIFDRESGDHMEDKFGVEWKKYLETGDIVLKWTKLTDKELNEIVNFLKKNKDELKAVPLSINLEGNMELSTRSILNLLDTNLVIHELNLHGTSVNASRIINALKAREFKMRNKERANKAAGKYGLRRLVLDNLSDADLKILAQFRQLRELDMDNSMLVSSKNIRFRMGIHQILEAIYVTSFSRENINSLEANIFNSFNYITVEGIRAFILAQKRTVAKAGGKTAIFNPYLSHVVIPVIKDDAVNNEVGDKLSVLFIKKSERGDFKNSLAELDVKLEIGSSSHSVSYQYTYDGDTVWIWDRKNNSQPIYSIRLNGIDTFEIDSTTPLELKLAKAARNFTAYHFKKAREIRVYSEGKWHHGRKIADVVLIINGKEFYINQELVINGLAIPYDGESNTTANSATLSVSAAKLYETFKTTVDYWYKKNPN